MDKKKKNNLYYLTGIGRNGRNDPKLAEIRPKVE